MTDEDGSGVPSGRGLRVSGEERRVSSVNVGKHRKGKHTIATSPQIAPVQNPTALHFLSNLQSKINQHAPPNEAARLVLVIATAALTLAAKVDPPLNPIHPTQRKIVPWMTKETLWGLKERMCVPKPRRLPRNKE